MFNWLKHEADAARMVTNTHVLATSVCHSVKAHLYTELQRLLLHPPLFYCIKYSHNFS